jgi:hypothetical protein
MAIRILRRLARAYGAQKELAQTLDRYKCELESIKAIIGIIQDEMTLQTASVKVEVLRLKVVEDKLLQYLEPLDTARRGAVKGFAHQFIHGPSEDKKLAAIMSDLGQV